jgi:hypothetical protein
LLILFSAHFRVQCLGCWLIRLPGAGGSMSSQSSVNVPFFNIFILPDESI